MISLGAVLESVRPVRSLLVLGLLLAGCEAQIPDPGEKPPVDGGERAADSGAGDAGADAGTTPTQDSGTPDAGCTPSDAGVLSATGTTRDLLPGGTLKALLAQSQPGDRVLVRAGQYASEQITFAPAGNVFVEAAPGEVATFDGLSFTSSRNLVLRGLRFKNTLKLDGSDHFLLDRLEIDVGVLDTTGLHLHGQGAAGATHDVRVIDSKIWGGARTIFILGKFAPSDTWNHHLEFLGNDFACGTHNCFQLSGARDTRIEGNVFHDPKGDGVLTAGATRIQILRNRMRGTKTVVAGAVRLATPGAQWDNYAGVENMISSDISVENNLISGWGAAGIELDAATNIRIVHNTVADGVGFKTWRRAPVDQQGKVILDGNTDVKLWNNILSNVQLDGADPRPVFESNNLVQSGGGGGTNLITGDPKFADTTSYEPSATSPAVDKGLVNAESPKLDFRGNVRGPAPDLGAIELGAKPHACP
jgi:hypothetical protein